MKNGVKVPLDQRANLTNDEFISREIDRSNLKTALEQIIKAFDYLSIARESGQPEPIREGAEQVREALDVGREVLAAIKS